MYICSVLFSFSEAAIKRRPRATETEIKLLMCRHSLKRVFNFELTVMPELDYKE